MMKLSLCIVARNEADYLRACIESARPVADEIVVVDTGSTDGTPEIARQAGARVFCHAWPGDLGRAHNLPLEHARGEWILCLDADETLDSGGCDELRRLIDLPGHDAYGVAIRNYVYVPGEKVRFTDPRDPQARGASYYIPTSIVRLFRRSPRHRFAGALHQTVTPSVRAAGGRIGASNLLIHHHGLLRTDRAKTPFYTALARRQVEADPASAQSWLDFGNVFSDRRDLPVALDAFRRARRRGERAASAFFIGAALARMDHPAAAIRHLEEALRRNRGDACPSFDRADALEELAEVYESLGDRQEAERAYRQALEARPGTPVAMNNLAALLLERGARREAAALLDRLLAGFPGLAAPWTTRGLLHLDRGDLPGARRAFETALEIHGQSLPALVNLALTHGMEGRPRLAARAYASAWAVRDGQAARELDLTACLPPPPKRRPWRRLDKGGVVSIIPHLYGGAGRVLVDIVLALRDRPHVVLCGDPGAYTRQGLRAELESAGAEVRTIGSTAGLNAALTALGPEQVIHHWWDDLVPGPSRAAGERWIAVGHSALPLPHGYDDYVVLSDFHRALQPHLDPARVHRIANGVDLSRFDDPPRRRSGPVTIAMVSRLDPAKFPRRLLALLPPLKDLGARVLVAGRGARRYEIEPEIAATASAGCVRFVGGLPSHRIPEFLRTADIGLHLTETHQEICPLAILEMLAAGLPIVAEPKGCLPELIADGVNGFLAWRPDAIARRLAGLIEDAGLRRRTGLAGRASARRYAMDRFAASWRDLVNGISRARHDARGGTGESARSGARSPRPSLTRRGGTGVDEPRAAQAGVSRWRPGLSYLVCATPRSGSNLLCEALWNTGVAGRPQEFFNSWTGQRTMRERAGPAFAEHVAAVQEMGSSANGVFGCKILHDDFARLLARLAACEGSALPPAALLDRAFPRVRYIWLVRRDRLRQAISWYRATASGCWADGGTPPPRPRYDASAIARCLEALRLQDEGWRRFFEQAGVRPLVLSYEDLDRDYEGAARTVLRFLGIRLPRPLYLGPRRLVRQSDDLTERWVRRFAGAAAHQQP